MEAFPGKLEVAEGLPWYVSCVHVEDLAVGSLVVPSREKDMSIYLTPGYRRSNDNVKQSKLYLLFEVKYISTNVLHCYPPNKANNQ